VADGARVEVADAINGAVGVQVGGNTGNTEIKSGVGIGGLKGLKAMRGLMKMRV
jgi:hypothetical protein